jgi:hypothetical protein
VSENDGAELGVDMYEGENFLEHIGIARRSGRYPWGSGDDPYQRSVGFKSYMDEMKSKGLSETQIAEALTEYANANRKEGEPFIPVKTTDLRAGIAISTEQIHAANVARARLLKDQRQMSNVAIANAMGTRESTVRGWLKAGDEVKENSLRAVANKLKEEVETKEYLDVGKGTNLWIGNVADSKLRSALAMLKDEGYNVYNMDVDQLGTDKATKLRVLTKEGNSWKDTLDAKNAGKVQTVGFQMDDTGTIRSNGAPESFSSKKLEVRYDEDGGSKMDGVIEVRRGKEELSLGANRYAQVRVAVDGTHYLKGMAMYADDLPAGVDIRFNTNKSKNDPKVQREGKLGALKPLKTDKDGNIDVENPFGATTKPHFYKDKSGKEKKSVLNMVNEEGSWDEWSKSLSSQMLSKQPLTLASKQLGETQKTRRQDLDEILKLTNPVVRQKLLDEYADSADAAAVHLKAAALPRQSSHVILPITSMRPHEIYAPNFDDGEKVVLVRYPHGGPFEIPSLTVNKKNAQAKRIMGGARDAVVIHPSVAEQLSGADFDGDSVLVIPNPKGSVKTRPPLKELEGFDAKKIYKIPEDDTTTPRMTKKNTQTEMGKISNLITDMTIHGASESEIAKAVKHSMVVIDAEKHGLNYKQSEQDNQIKMLKTKYQEGPRKGANTIISRASSTARIDKVMLRPAKDGGPVDPKTGRLVYVPDPKREYPKTRPVIDPKTGQQKVDPKTGKKVYEETGEVGVKQTKGTKMEFADDARKLLSKNPAPMEELYAAHANTMKALANEARLASLNTTLPRQNKAAKVVYKDEVKSLEDKLREAQRNAPLERRAQILGNANARARIDAHPEYEKDDIKKVKFQELERARLATGAAKKKIGAVDEHGNSTLTTREWEAIQAGAFSSSRLKEILANADMERVRTLATPKTGTSLTTGQIAKAKQMAASGRSMSEISEALGIPRSTIVDNLNRG